MQFFSKATTRAYLTSFATNPLILEEWQHFGGLETLISYGIVPPINTGADAQAQLAAAFRQALPASHRRFLDNLKIVIYVWRFLFRPCGRTARHSASKAARRRFAVDSTGFSSLRRGIQQDHRPRAHARAGARNSCLTASISTLGPTQRDGSPA